ncbi:hypothetical protein TWF694_004271 [Orbilia ellipsospora]|uniref:Uncharacterized protein n=1 Tax=Orbilia ellipsospora TaxID=2528407 RepID=A0AAV9WYH2_9PEZI
MHLSIIILILFNVLTLLTNSSTAIVLSAPRTPDLDLKPKHRSDLQISKTPNPKLKSHHPLLHRADDEGDDNQGHTTHEDVEDVQCLTPDAALNLFYARVAAGQHPLLITDWVFYDQEFGRDRTLDAMQDDIDICRGCGCSGEVVDQRTGRLKLKTKRFEHDPVGCDNDIVEDCEQTFGCFCLRTIRAKGGRRPVGVASGGWSLLGEPVKLNKLRTSLTPKEDVFANINRDRPGGSGKNPVRFGNHRKKAPGTKEPYWLEGPDVDLRPTWNFILGLRTGASGGLFKRNGDDNNDKGNKRDGGDSGPENDGEEAKDSSDADKVD